MTLPHSNGSEQFSGYEAIAPSNREQNGSVQLTLLPEYVGENTAIANTLQILIGGEDMLKRTRF